MPRNCIKQFLRHQAGLEDRCQNPRQPPRDRPFFDGYSACNCGSSAADAAKAIRGSESKISRIELGKSAIREIDVLDLLTMYGVDPSEREQFLTLAEQASRRGWWHQFS